MINIEAKLEDLEEKLISYESFKEVLQQYLQRLLTSDQDTLAVVSELLDAVKSLSAARALADTPAELHQVLALQEDALHRFGGLTRVEDDDAPSLLQGGIVKVDDPQVYGMSLICTWLDCIVSNPEQSLDSLRKVFLQTNDPWTLALNRIFHIDIGQRQPIVNPDLWLASLIDKEQASSLHLARLLNTAQALELEPPQPIGPIPLAVWRHLLHTRPVYDLTARYARDSGKPGHTRVIALRGSLSGDDQPLPCLYRLGLPPPPFLPPGKTVTLGDLQTQMGCSLSTPVRLEGIEKAEHLSGNTPPIFIAHMPLGKLEASFSLILNHPPQVVVEDVTPTTALSTYRLLRVSASKGPSHRTQLFRLQTLPQNEWPSQHGWTRVYRFHNLGEIGVSTCPPGSFLEVSLRDDGEIGTEAEEAEVHFYRWGEGRHSLRISAAGLRRAAQTGTLIFLGANEETALEILTALQGLIGPVAQKIDPVVSRLETQVRWRTRMGGELFATER